MDSPNVWSRSNYNRVSPSPADWDKGDYDYNPDKYKQKKKKKKSKRKKSEANIEKAAAVATTAVVASEVAELPATVSLAVKDSSVAETTAEIKEEEIPNNETTVEIEEEVEIPNTDVDKLYETPVEDRNLTQPSPPPPPVKTPETLMLATQIVEEQNEDEVTEASNKIREYGKHWTPYLPVRRRNKLFEKPVKQLKGFKGWKHRQKMNWRKLKFFCKGVSYKLELWGSWLRKIEGHQGTGCVSYFVFLRWLFGLNIFLFILLFLAVTLPFVALSSLGYGYSVTGSSTDSDTTTAATCSAIYTSSINVSSSASDLILDFVQGTGWMENTALFYGYYNSIEMYFGSSGGTTLNYVIPLAYLLVSLICLLVSLILMARYTVTAFKENLLASQDGAQATVYCNKVFGGWDFALKEAEAAKLKNKSIYKDLVADLAEQKFRLTQKHKTRGQKCGLYTVRFFINLLVLILLAGAGAAIYFAQNFATTECVFTIGFFGSINSYNL